MKVRTILQALDGAPGDADVVFTIRGIKVAAPKKENPKPSIVKKPASKSRKPMAKPLARKRAVAKKTSGRKR